MQPIIFPVEPLDSVPSAPLEMSPTLRLQRRPVEEDSDEYEELRRAEVLARVKSRR